MLANWVSTLRLEVAAAELVDDIHLYECLHSHGFEETSGIVCCTLEFTLGLGLLEDGDLLFEVNLGFGGQEFSKLRDCLADRLSDHLRLDIEGELEKCLDRLLQLLVGSILKEGGKSSEELACLVLDVHRDAVVGDKALEDGENLAAVSWSLNNDDLNSCFISSEADIFSLIKACFGDEESNDRFHLLGLHKLSDILEDLRNGNSVDTVISNKTHLNILIFVVVIFSGFETELGDDRPFAIVECDHVGDEGRLVGELE